MGTPQSAHRIEYYTAFLDWFDLPEEAEEGKSCKDQSRLPAGGYGDAPGYFHQAWDGSAACIPVTWQTGWTIYARDDYKRCVCDFFGEGEASCPQADQADESDENDNDDREEEEEDRKKKNKRSQRTKKTKNKTKKSKRKKRMTNKMEKKTKTMTRKVNKKTLSQSQLKTRRSRSKPSTTTRTTAKTRNQEQCSRWTDRWTTPRIS